jgi:hypothetical protein
VIKRVLPIVIIASSILGFSGYIRAFEEVDNYFIIDEKAPSVINCRKMDQPLLIKADFHEDPNGDYMQYYFDWGDGINSGWVYGHIAFHNYEYYGIYNINITIKDSNNTSYYREIEVRIKPDSVPPTESWFDRNYPYLIVGIGLFFSSLLIMSIYYKVKKRK